MVTFLFFSVNGAFSPRKYHAFFLLSQQKSLFERKKHGKYNQHERNDVVPTEGLGLEHRNDDDGKYDQRDGFLDDFQLNEIERTSVDYRADTVGGNHKKILYQRNAP